MTIENALPEAAPAAGAGYQHEGAAPDQQHDEHQAANEGESGDEGQHESEGSDEKPKKEKTPEQRELDRIRRGLDRKTKQNYQLKAQLEQLAQSSLTQREQNAGINAQTNDEPLTLSRAELEKMVKERAERMAPAIRHQQAEMEQRRAVVADLAKEWGQEKFDAYASDLDDAFGGLADAKGNPKPITNAIFESDAPAAVIAYLADPDNASEAENLSGMSDREAARAVAKLEAKLETMKSKPQRSNAPAPLEPLKGNGKSMGSMPNPGDTKTYIKWANEQERRR